MGTRNGIDVSWAQGNIDWSKVKTDFAMVRAGWSWYNGGMNIDKQFFDNASGATAANIPWGVYMYAYDKSVSAAIVAATVLCDTLDKGNYKLSYPVAYDFEDPQYFSTAMKESNTEICNAFLSVIKNRGYYPALYTFSSFATSYLNMDKLKEYDFWVADYTGKVTYKGDYTMWQYSSNGKVDGISTDVDMDVCHKDYPTIISNMKSDNRVGITKDKKDQLNVALDMLQANVNVVRNLIDGIDAI